MDISKISKQMLKWTLLANLVGRELRKYSIIKNIQQDPTILKIYDLKNQIFSKKLKK